MATIKDFIDTTILHDLNTMIQCPGLQYLSFGVMGSLIEFLGACHDTCGFFEEGVSEKRFRAAICKLDSFSAYRKYNKSGNGWLCYETVPPSGIVWEA